MGFENLVGLIESQKGTFLFKGKHLNPANVILSLKALIHHINQPCSFRVKEKFEEEEIPTMIRSKEEVLIFSDAAFREVDGKDFCFGYVAMLKGIVVDASP